MSDFRSGDSSVAVLQPGEGELKQCPILQAALQTGLLLASTVPATFHLRTCLLHLHAAQDPHIHSPVRSRVTHENLRSIDVPQWVEMKRCQGALRQYILKMYYLF